MLFRCFVFEYQPKNTQCSEQKKNLVVIGRRLKTPSEATKTKAQSRLEGITDKFQGEKDSLGTGRKA